MRYGVFAIVLCMVVGTVAAGELQKGDNEVALRLAYSDTDFGSNQGTNFGSAESTDIALTYGWLVTDSHEFGVVAGYTKEEIDGGDLAADFSSDGIRLGAFYNYNFKTQGTLTPYLGAVVATLEGDLGDAYNLQYAVEVGLKIYPFEHGGLSIGLGYSELRADAAGLPDANGLSLGIGLLLKY